jgi:hypothetical protein
MVATADRVKAMVKSNIHFHANVASESATNRNIDLGACAGSDDEEG